MSSKNTLPSLLDDHPAAAEPARRPSVGGGIGGSKEKLKLGGALAALVVAGGLLSWQLFGGPPSPAELSRYQTVIDRETGELFEQFRTPKGGRAPYENPKTGRATLVPAEPCYWTKDGKAKLTPTWVLLNEYSGKEGTTLCPDCGRRVVSLNPSPPGKLMVEAAEREAKGGK